MKTIYGPLIFMTIVFSGTIFTAEDMPITLQDRALTDDLAKRIPEELIYERKTLKQDNNALDYFIRAGEKTKNLEDYEQYFAAMKEIKSGNFPEGNIAKSLETWFSKNQEALSFLNAGIEIGNLQIPLRASASPATIKLSQIRELSRLLYMKSLWHLHRNEHLEAANTAISGMRLGEMVIGAEGSLIDSIMGIAILSHAMEGAIHFARCPNASEVALRNCLAHVQCEFDFVKSAVRCAQIEFKNNFADPILNLSKTGNAHQWVLQFMSHHNGKPLSETSNLVILAILGKSPNPFIPEATLIQAADYFATIVHDSKNQWINKASSVPKFKLLKGEMEQASEIFNKVLWKAALIELPKEQKQKVSGLIKEFRKIGDIVDLHGIFEEMTEAEWNQARELFGREENIIGKIYIELAVGACSRMNFHFRQSQTFRSVATLMFALRIYRIKTSSWPDSLDNLIEHGLLKTLPVDPFSGKSFLYSRKLNKIWSVGPDGVDNSGADAEKDNWTENQKDAVWLLPK